MFNVDETTVCHNVPSLAQQDPHLEYDRDSLRCPGAPKLGFILSPEAEKYTENDYDDAEALFGLCPEAPPLVMVCPGAPRIPFIEQFEGPPIATDQLLTHHDFCQRSPIPFEDVDDNDNMEGLFGLYPETSPSTLVCPGAPKLPFIEDFEGPSLIADEYGFCSRSFLASSDDYHFDDEENDDNRSLFGLFPEPLTFAATHLCRRVGHARRDSDELSSGSPTTSPALSTPPASEFLHQDGCESSDKKVELLSNLVIVGEPAIISRDEQL
jgi:hypothetical protein